MAAPGFSFWQDVAYGGIAGSVSEIIVMPPLIVRTRMMVQGAAGAGGGGGMTQVRPRNWANFSPAAFDTLTARHVDSCIPTEMHGPACIVWANLTPFSLQYSGFVNCFTKMYKEEGIRSFYKVPARRSIAQPPQCLI